MELEERHRWWKSRGKRELRALLMAHWDPIDVRGIPEAQDEYDGYLGSLIGRLDDGADAQAIAEYLADVQTERMGLSVTPDELREAASRIVGWYRSEAQR